MVTTTQQTHKKYIYKHILQKSTTHNMYVRLKLKYFIHKQIETFSEMRQKSLECHSQNQNILSIEIVHRNDCYYYYYFLSYFSSVLFCVGSKKIHNLRSADENRNDNKKKIILINDDNVEYNSVVHLMLYKKKEKLS